MRHPYLDFVDLKDRDGRTIPSYVQILAFLIWTAPERGLTMRDYRRVLRRVGDMFGYRIGFWAAVRFTRNTPRVGRVTRSWLRAEYYLEDAQMDRRQQTVFQEGLRGTGFDKMGRIRERAMIGTEYHRMGPETCDRAPLFRELSHLDLTMMIEGAEEGSDQPPAAIRTAPSGPEGPDAAEILSTGSGPEAVERLLTEAQSRGWETIRVKGEQAFCVAIKHACEQRGYGAIITCTGPLGVKWPSRTQVVMPKIKTSGEFSSDR
jgi:hypothetical protein